MTFSSRAIHVLVAATFVFVNLVCPCVSAYESAAAFETTSNCHDKPSTAPAAGPLPLDEHQDCADCTFALALGCEKRNLAAPTAQITLPVFANMASDPDSDTALLVRNVTSLPPPVFVPPEPRLRLAASCWASLVDSPIRRHDRTLV